MILWINGAFGSGKTTSAYELHRRLPNSFVYDPENIGYFLFKNVPAKLRMKDFQDHPQWRLFNYEMLKDLAGRFDGVIIAPMTVTTPQYFEEIIGRLRRGENNDRSSPYRWRGPRNCRKKQNGAAAG